MNAIESLKYYYPELTLTTFLLLVIIVDLFVKEKKSVIAAYVSLIGLVISFFSLLEQYSMGPQSLFSNMVVVDPFALFFKVVFVVSTIIITLFSIPSIELMTRRVGEYYALLLAVTLGMFLMASATDLIMVYLALELVSLSSYVLAGYLKDRSLSSEASFKYVIYGAVSSGVMLYGLSLVYGIAGTTNIFLINGVLAGSETYGLTLFLALIFILAGFGYKIAAAPFHFWTPDVYEGSPTPITAFLSVGPKAAGFALMIRFFYVALVQSTGTALQWEVLSSLDWTPLLWAISAATMTLGNLVALVQKNVKRMLAYSSIAHSGYILMGILALNGEGLQAMMFYLVVYLFMNLGAFLVVIAVSDKLNSEDLRDYKGLAGRAPFLAVAMAVFMLALTGLPPTAGFVGKVYLFAAIIHGKYYWLAIIAVINTVISLYYYWGVVKVMFLDESAEKTPLAISPFYTFLLAALLIPTILFGVYWAPLAEFTNYSLRFFSGY